MRGARRPKTTQLAPICPSDGGSGSSSGRCNTSSAAGCFIFQGGGLEGGREAEMSASERDPAADPPGCPAPCEES